MILQCITLICILSLLGCSQNQVVIESESLPRDSNVEIIDMNQKFSVSEPKSSTEHLDSPHLDWEIPPKWKPIDAGTFAKEKYVLQDNLQLSISAFPGSAGGLLSNVNRWRQQLNLQAIKITELASYCSTLQTPFKNLTIVTITDSNQANQGRILYVALFDYENEQWFIKVIGSRRSFNSEYPRIIKFLKSIKNHD